MFLQVFCQEQSMQSPIYHHNCRGMGKKNVATSKSMEYIEDADIIIET
jgi:hypothetical protein